jgi:APA family basic amino acid/polyamine antiporter
MALFLPSGTWIRLLVWSIIGFALYFVYGYKHSRLRSGAAPVTDATQHI